MPIPITAFEDVAERDRHLAALRVDSSRASGSERRTDLLAVGARLKSRNGFRRSTPRRRSRMAVGHEARIADRARSYARRRKMGGSSPRRLPVAAAKSPSRARRRAPHRSQTPARSRRPYVGRNLAYVGPNFSSGLSAPASHTRVLVSIADSSENARSRADWNRSRSFLEAPPQRPQHAGATTTPALSRVWRILFQDRRHRLGAVSRWKGRRPVIIS